jgi:hypothetical protein
MVLNQSPEEFDLLIRSYVYETAMQQGRLPKLAETAEALSVPIEEVKASYQRLAAGRVLVLQGETSEILMANPYSAVPTPFLVEVEGYSCYANCIWDALGIPAMLKKDARIKTSCGDCGAALELQVVDGAVQGDEGILHFALPTLRWWENIVFT